MCWDRESILGWIRCLPKGFPVSLDTTYPTLGNICAIPNGPWLAEESSKIAAVKSLYSQRTGQGSTGQKVAPTSLEKCCGGSSYGSVPQPLQELVDWQGAIGSVALLCSLGCPGQLKVRRIPGQGVEACAVGGCYLLTPAQISKGRFIWAGDTLVCSLNSLGPIRLHGCCASSRFNCLSSSPLSCKERKEEDSGETGKRVDPLQPGCLTQ